MKVFNRPKNKAILPAEVRFHPDLNDGEILAYGEIAALCGKKTFCWPKNNHLAQLLNKSTKTISRAIKKLTDLKLITVKSNPEKGDRREIHLLPLPGTSETQVTDKNVQGGGHLWEEKPDSLLIVFNNDISNDRSESILPAQKLKKEVEFFKDSGLLPTKDDIRNIMGKVPSTLTKGLDLDLEANKFYLYYKSNGWKIGSSKMVCLPSAIEKWFLTALNFKKNVTTQRNTNQHKSFNYLAVGNYTGREF
ncbi:helix-turn-helix domain-containing protein [Adhaeribacter soli]|uniref:Helix-turn-helix domain-containing protein n=1 Tax=Adhaeribacter soli TaxID=2607655 RepID=A0A5N1J616_9BACT|nr:helix-turn-helix domain-containing protein [Adhaeribacter soli]KAA9340142.1 hypothetical protein F0P94_07275 [Adhaeribacter soli]